MENRNNQVTIKNSERNYQLEVKLHPRPHLISSPSPQDTCRTGRNNWNYVDVIKSSKDEDQNFTMKNSYFGVPLFFHSPDKYMY